jgi:hypothetical protein
MSNLFKMAVRDTIRTLHHWGWSQRRIADELGINRETVARHLRPADPPSRPANAPPGSTVSQGASKPANAPPGSETDQDVAKPANATPGSEADQDAAGLPPIAGGPRPSAGLAGDPYSAGGWGILVGSPIM